MRKTSKIVWKKKRELVSGIEGFQYALLRPFPAIVVETDDTGNSQGSHSNTDAMMEAEIRNK